MCRQLKYISSRALHLGLDARLKKCLDPFKLLDKLDSVRRFCYTSVEPNVLLTQFLSFKK